jgi:hypothetical protein
LAGEAIAKLGVSLAQIASYIWSYRVHRLFCFIVQHFLDGEFPNEIPDFLKKSGIWATGNEVIAKRRSPPTSRATGQIVHSISL